ncbi:hypothetical protein AWB75_05051 [Caballeronia catudaia]|uniref:Zinc-ribbon domain-containing protein n=1 Tax=Caballeronia catudaia TaxID=1777136 RepID=A0A158CFC5_9BURK|nr:hypothetical protein [Caballeronia catudaia]SAK80992.1 hypothetical protein AWB75_05051 [Caballeronia catudaia]
MITTNTAMSTSFPLAASHRVSSECKISEDTRIEVNPYLAKLQARAARLGWQCLSKAWRGMKARYEFECAKGHRFEREASVFRRTPQCMDCEADEIRARCLTRVSERGGTLLGAFTGLRDRHRVRCANGHEWDVSGNGLSQGNWCPHCRYEDTTRRQLHEDGLARLQAGAASRGGRCLAESYAGGRTYYLCECACGHRWEARGDLIMDGKGWCPRCTQAARAEKIVQANFHHDGLARLREAARQRKGECLSSDYTGSYERYRFRCEVGHEWTSSASAIWQGLWCKRCGNLARRTPIETLQAIAAERGGQCLSSESIGNKVKHTWQCHLGHVWQATPSNVKQGRWCPNCANLERSKQRAKRERWDVRG